MINFIVGPTDATVVVTSSSGKPSSVSRFHSCTFQMILCYEQGRIYRDA